MHPILIQSETSNVVLGNPVGDARSIQMGHQCYRREESQVKV